MAIFILKLVLFMSVIVSVDGIIKIDYSAKYVDEIVRYIHVSKPKLGYKTCFMHLISNSSMCNFILPVLLKNLPCSKYVMNHLGLSYANDSESSISLLVFNDASTFNETLSQYVNSGSFRNTGHYQLILCFPVYDKKWLDTAVKTTWNYRILNLVVLYYNNTLFEITYNPFIDVIEYKNASNLQQGHNPFPDKLKNMHLYPIVACFSYRRFYVGSTYRDYNYNFERALKNCFNLSLNIIKLPKDQSTYNDVEYLISSTDLEISLNSVLMDNINTTKMWFTYPHMLNPLIAIVPKPDKSPKWKSFFKDILLRFLMQGCILSVMLAFCHKYIGDKTRKLDVFGFITLYFTSSLPHFVKEKSIVKSSWFILTIWNTAWLNVAVLNHVIVDHFEIGIVTLQDMMDSNIPIYYYDYDIPTKYNATKISKTVFFDKIANNEKVAMIAPLDVLKRVELSKSYDQRPFHFNFLEEEVKPAFGTFPIKGNSPYQQKLKLITMRIPQFGVRASVSSTKHSVLQPPKVVLLAHLSGIFIVWMIGLCISIIIFIIEMCYFYSCRNCEKRESIISDPIVIRRTRFNVKENV